VIGRPATDGELRLCHTAAHIRHVDGGFARKKERDDDEYNDIYFSKGTALAARLAAGTVDPF
jgi:acetoin utilization deacetylase AcuC-like enzyme